MGHAPITTSLLLSKISFKLNGMETGNHGLGVSRPWPLLLIFILHLRKVLGSFI